MSTYLTGLFGRIGSVAIFGWGYLILRLCGFSKNRFRLAGSLGLAFLVAAGGVLNYFQLVSKSLLIIF